MTNWITTKKPDKAGEYIVTIEGAVRATSLRYNETVGWYEIDTDGTIICYHVVAWMEFPEGYEVEARRKEREILRTVYDEPEGKYALQEDEE